MSDDLVVKSILLSPMFDAQRVVKLFQEYNTKRGCQGTQSGDLVYKGISGTLLSSCGWTLTYLLQGEYKKIKKINQPDFIMFLISLNLIKPEKPFPIVDVFIKDGAPFSSLSFRPEKLRKKILDHWRRVPLAFQVYQNAAGDSVLRAELGRNFLFVTVRNPLDTWIGDVAEVVDGSAVSSVEEEPAAKNKKLAAQAEALRDTGNTIFTSTVLKFQDTTATRLKFAYKLQNPAYEDTYVTATLYLPEGVQSAMLPAHWTDMVRNKIISPRVASSQKLATAVDFVEIPLNR